MQIVRVVQLYIDGWKGDVNKFKEAFHEDAWIFFTDAEGILHKDLLTDRFEAWAAANRHIEGRVIAVTQAGDVASVLLGFDNTTDPSASFVASTRCSGLMASGKSRTRPPPTAVGPRGPPLSLLWRAGEGVWLLLERKVALRGVENDRYIPHDTCSRSADTTVNSALSK